MTPDQRNTLGKVFTGIAIAAGAAAAYYMAKGANAREAGEKVIRIPVKVADTTIDVVKKVSETVTEPVQTIKHPVKRAKKVAVAVATLPVEVVKDVANVKPKRTPSGAAKNAPAKGSESAKKWGERMAALRAAKKAGKSNSENIKEALEASNKEARK